MKITHKPDWIIAHLPSYWAAYKAPISAYKGLRIKYGIDRPEPFIKADTEGGLDIKIKQYQS